MFNTTFNKITAISSRSVLLVEENGVPGRNQRPVENYRQTLSHNVASSTPRLSGIQTHNVSGDISFFILIVLYSLRTILP